MGDSKVLRRAVFLDRDGTLNKDTGYVHRKEDWQWLPGVPEALKRLRAVGYVLVVVSNQSGIARGFYDHEDLRRVREVQAGLAAGCQSILLHADGSDNRDDDEVPDGVAVVPHLPAATVRILAPRMRQLRTARMLEKMKE